MAVIDGHDRALVGWAFALRGRVQDAERGYGPGPTTAARAAPPSPVPAAARVVAPTATIASAAADAVLGLGSDFLD